MLPLIQLTLAQKVVLMVSLPVTGMLLYLLFRNNEEDEEYEEEIRAKKVVTSRQTVIEVKVPRDAVGAIIGSQGAQIKQIQDSSGARVNFKDEVTPDTVERTLVIRGTDNSAQEAELLIQKIIADQPPIITDSMSVPQRSLGRIIGKNGDTIRTMSRQSKARIIIDRSEEKTPDGMKEITIKGTPDAVNLAKSMISEKVEEEKIFRAKVAVAAANRQPRSKNAAIDSTVKGSEHVPRGSGDDGDSHAVSESASSSQSTSRRSSETTTTSDVPASSSAEDRLRECSDFLEVYVSAVEHPSHFWVQVLTNKSTKLDDLIQDMTRYYSSPEVMQASQVLDPRVDDIVAAVFPHDKLWYRARILGVQDDEVDLYYVDFGDSEVMPRKDILTLRGDFFSLPFQAFECSLAHVKPKDSNEWSEEAIEVFEELTYCAKWKVLMSRTVSYSRLPSGEAVPCLKMVDTNTDNDIDIAETLVSRGLADWDLTEEGDLQNTSGDLASTTKVAAAQQTRDMHAL